MIDTLRMLYRACAYVVAFVDGHVVANVQRIVQSQSQAEHAPRALGVNTESKQDPDTGHSE